MLDARNCRVEVYHLNNKTCVFYSLYDDETQRCNIYLINIDDQGNQSEPLHLGDPGYNYELLVTPDKKNFGMVFLYRDSLPPNGKNPAYNSYHDRAVYNFYDGKTTEIIFSKSITDINYRMINRIENYIIDNNGSLSFLRYIGVTRFSDVLKQFDLGILSYNKSETEYFPLNIPGVFTPNLSVLSTGDLLVTFTTNEFKFVRILVTPSAVNESTPIKIKYAKLDSINVEMKLRPVVKSIYENDNTYSIFNPNAYVQPQYIGVAQLNKEGKLNWFKYMPISVACVDLYGKQKYKMSIVNNKLVYYFNDEPKNDAMYKSSVLTLKTVRAAVNPKSIDLVCLTFDEKGNMHRETIYNNSEFMILTSPLNEDFHTPFLRMYSKDKEKFARIK